MATDPDNVIIAGTGRVLAAPVGSAVPVGLAAFVAPWVDTGLTTDDGVAFRNVRTMLEVGAWQVLGPVRRAMTGRATSFSVTMLEWAREQIKLAYGGGTIDSPSVGLNRYRPPDASEIDERTFAIEWLDKGFTYRLYVVRGLVSDNIDTTLTKTGAALLPLTININEPGAGVDPWYLITDDPALAPAA